MSNHLPSLELDLPDERSPLALPIVDTPPSSSSSSFVLPPSGSIPRSIGSSIQTWWKHSSENGMSIAEERLLNRLPSFISSDSAPDPLPTPSNPNPLVSRVFNAPIEVQSRSSSSTSSPSTSPSPTPSVKTPPSNPKPNSPQLTTEYLHGARGGDVEGASRMEEGTERVNMAVVSGRGARSEEVERSVGLFSERHLVCEAGDRMARNLLQRNESRFDESNFQRKSTRTRRTREAEFG